MNFCMYRLIIFVPWVSFSYFYVFPVFSDAFSLFFVHCWISKEVQKEIKASNLLRRNFVIALIVHLTATLSNKIFFRIQHTDHKYTINFNNPLLGVDKCLWNEKLEISIRGYRTVDLFDFQTEKIHIKDLRFPGKMPLIQQKFSEKFRLINFSFSF